MNDNKNPAYNTAAYSRNDQADVLRELWEKTIGKAGMPESRIYIDNDFEFTKKMPLGEAAARVELAMMNNPGISIKPSQVGQRARLKTTRHGILNHFTFSIKYEGQPQFEITFHTGLYPDPSKPVSQWDNATATQMHGMMTVNNPMMIRFMDLNPQCSKSPVYWSKEKLKKHGIEMIQALPLLAGRTPFYDWKESVVDGEAKETERRFEADELISTIYTLPLTQKEALATAIYGKERVLQVLPTNKSRDLQVMLGDIARTDPERLKKAMIGDFHKIIEVLGFAKERGIIKFEGDEWLVKTGTIYTVIDGSYISADRPGYKDPLMYLANHLFGKGDDECAKPRLYADILAQTRDSINEVAPKEPEVERHADNVADTSIDEATFYILLEKAISNGDIVFDMKAKRAKFNPAKEGDDAIQFILGGFAPNGKTMEEQLESAKATVLKKAFKNKEAVLKRLGV